MRSGYQEISRGDQLLAGCCPNLFSLFFTAALQCPTRESEDKGWKGGVIDFPEISYTIQPSFSILP